MPVRRAKDCRRIALLSASFWRILCMQAKYVHCFCRCPFLFPIFMKGNIIVVLGSETGIDYASTYVLFPFGKKETRHFCFTSLRIQFTRFADNHGNQKLLGQCLSHNRLAHDKGSIMLNFFDSRLVFLGKSVRISVVMSGHQLTPETYSKILLVFSPCLLRLLKPLPRTRVTNYAWAAAVLIHDIVAGTLQYNVRCYWTWQSDCDRKNADCNSTALNNGKCSMTP